MAQKYIEVPIDVTKTAGGGGVTFNPMTRNPAPEGAKNVVYTIKFLGQFGDATIWYESQEIVVPTPNANLRATFITGKHNDEETYETIAYVNGHVHYTPSGTILIPQGGKGYSNNLPGEPKATIYIRVYYDTFPSVFVNIGGVNKECEDGWVNINGVWKQIDSIFVNVGGVWKTT